MEHATTTSSDVLYEVSDGVATLTISREKVLNAVRAETLDQLTSLLRRAGDDREVGVIVLTGAGERAFCAGGDINWEATPGYGGRDPEPMVKELYAVMREVLKPIIARVNGYAIGGGNHMAYFCDFTVAADHAIFGQNGPRVGSPAQGWYVSYLISVVGAKRAREMWMLCERYSAQRALDWGLINAVVPMAELDTEVRRWCDSLLEKSPTVIKLLKRTFDESWRHLREMQDGDYLPEINPNFWESGEPAEGSKAFLEKRTPDFSRFR